MTASVRTLQPNPTDRDHLREQWRLAAMEWARAEDIASRMEEGRRVVMDQITLELVKAGDSVAKAEKVARTSERFLKYLKSMHDARKVANELRIQKENADRAYWEQVSVEAQSRAEMRMTR